MPQGGAERLLESRHAAALAVLIEARIAKQLYRVGPPGLHSWLHAGTWQRVSDAQMQGILLEHADADVEPRAILVARSTADGGAVAVADCERCFRLTEASSWLGWPLLRDGRWPNSILDALRARDNNYWLLDTAAAALGFSSLTRDGGRPNQCIPSLSVVMPGFGVQEVVGGAVECVIRAASRLADPDAWECIVVDDANDPPLRLPTGLPKQVRMIRSASRLSCGGARNAGLAQARGQIVVFCDADTHMDEAYLAEHVARHVLAPNLILVSMREHVTESAAVPSRSPNGERDTRVEATYTPDRIGLHPTTARVTVRPLGETNEFREFGFGRLLGPVDLAFMVKGNNFSIGAAAARGIGFPPDFEGWGPEDVCFAAKAISRGAFVVPVLSTGVFHRAHPPRSGSDEQRHIELRENLSRYAAHLGSAYQRSWQTLGRS